MGFSYERKGLDELGHVVYFCKCSKCGFDVIYYRAVESEPLCQVCYEKKRNEQIRLNKKKKPVNELVKAIRGYYESHDQMPSMKIVEELAESVIGG